MYAEEAVAVMRQAWLEGTPSAPPHRKNRCDRFSAFAAIESPPSHVPLNFGDKDQTFVTVPSLHNAVAGVATITTFGTTRT